MNKKLAESYALYFEGLINALSKYVIDQKEAPEDLVQSILTLAPMVENEFEPNEFEQLMRVLRAYQTWLKGLHPDVKPHWVGSHK